jgi:hypothetical protein
MGVPTAMLLGVPDLNVFELLLLLHGEDGYWNTVMDHFNFSIKLNQCNFAFTTQNFLFINEMIESLCFFSTPCSDPPIQDRVIIV